MKTLAVLLAVIGLAIGTACLGQPSATWAVHAQNSTSEAGTPPNGGAGRGWTAQHSEAPERLFGTWVSVSEVDSPVGPVKVQVTFREEEPVKIVAWSTLPLVGTVKETKGPYQVEGNRISSAAIQGGTTVTYGFNEQGNLMIHYEDGRVIEFRRG